MIIERAVRVWIAVMVFPSLVFAIELKSMGSRHLTEPFYVLFQEEGKIGYFTWGESFLEGGQSQKAKTRGIDKKRLKKAYVVWGGKIQRSEKEKARWIEIKESGGEFKIKANRFYTTLDEAGTIAYVAAANITTVMKRKEIKDIQAVRKHIMGGYSVIEVYEDAKAPKRYVAMKIGIARLKPGEIYHIHLLDKEEKVGRVTQMSTVGAGAVSGNGSGSMINDVSVSSKEEWDGSNGEKWDVDTFEITNFQVLTKEGVLWSIDPLLQWLYPMGVVIQVDLSY